KVELVAFCVPTKIVVIVENENACRRLVLSIEISGREPTDTATDDHEVVVFRCAKRREGEIAVPKLVRQLERPRVAAAEPGQTRRIVAPTSLRCRLACQDFRRHVR